VHIDIDPAEIHKNKHAHIPLCAGAAMLTWVGWVLIIFGVKCEALPTSIAHQHRPSRRSQEHACAHPDMCRCVTGRGKCCCCIEWTEIFAVDVTTLLTLHVGLHVMPVM
jgi:hypothetical protein